MAAKEKELKRIRIYPETGKYRIAAEWNHSIAVKASSLQEKEILMTEPKVHKDSQIFHVLKLKDESGYYAIQNKRSGLYWEIGNYGLIQTKWHNGDNQKFCFIIPKELEKWKDCYDKVPKHTLKYKIRAKSTGKYLTADMDPDVQTDTGICQLPYNNGTYNRQQCFDLWHPDRLKAFL